MNKTIKEILLGIAGVNIGYFIGAWLSNTSISLNGYLFAIGCTLIIYGILRLVNIKLKVL